MAGDALGSKLVRPARIAIVGHTNAGKTSLIRTLTRNTGFGAVSQEPSTTKHVEEVRLLAEGVPVIDLYDTPGMEEPIQLRDLIKQIETMAEDRPDGPTLIERFLHSEDAKSEFEQEAKVLRQLLASDAGLYVIDTRDPVLPKYQQELDILRLCGKPLVAVLNFVSMPTARADEWRVVLRRVGLHVHVHFDAVAPEQDAEATLYGGLKVQLNAFSANFERLIACRRKEARERHSAAQKSVADMMIDLAAVQIEYPNKHKEPTLEVKGALAHKVIARERQFVAQLLEVYQFTHADVVAENLPLIDGYWQDDPFDRQNLERLGLDLATGIATGAAAGAAGGAVVDATVGGLTLGVGMAVGALIGGGSAAYRKRYEDIRRIVKRTKRIVVDDLVLLVVVLRGLHLVSRLELRGHGAVLPMQLPGDVDPSKPEVKLPGTIDRARRNPAWSRLNGYEISEVRREKEVLKLCNELEALRSEQTRREFDWKSAIRQRTVQ